MRNPPPVVTQTGLPENGKIPDKGNTLPSVGSVEPALNPGKESYQENAPGSQEYNLNLGSDGVGTVPPPGPDAAGKLKADQPDEERQHPGPAAYGNQAGPRLPSADDESISRGHADSSVIPQISESRFTDSSKPPLTTAPSNSGPLIPPPSTSKGEDQQSNGASAGKSSVQGIIQSGGSRGAPVTPEVTFLKAQPNVNRNRAIAALVIAGVGFAALYVFNPQVRQWVFTQYVRIFRRATPQSASNETLTQPQETSYASAQDYARVNDPNGVAFF